MSEPSGASITTRSRLPAQPGRAGQGHATNGTGHDGSSTARSSRESGPAAITARGLDAVRSRAIASAVAASGVVRLATHARTTLGERAQAQVDRGERALVVEPGLVEPGRHLASRSPGQAGLRASSTRSTGMSSRTG